MLQTTNCRKANTALAPAIAVNGCNMRYSFANRNPVRER
jgi:hypothetical protein